MKAIRLISVVLAFLTAGSTARAELVRLVDESQVACQAPCARAAVVFIHGILGSKETWQNESAFWPTLLATDPAIGDKVDVYRVDFDSYMFSESPSLVEVLTELQDRLDKLLEAKRYQKVFLVGHSLGGNVARAYLLHIKAKYGHRALSAFRVTYTLGTPMLGSSLASVASFASRNQQLRVLLPIKVNDFQQLLNLTLVDIENKHHQVFCPPMSVFSAYEMQPMDMVGIVVPEESATAYASATKGFDRTHSSLVKPRDRTDPVYRWVADSMAVCMAGQDYCSRPILPDCGRLPEGWPDPKLDVAPRLSPVRTAR